MTTALSRRKKLVVFGDTPRHLLSFRGPFLFEAARRGHEVIAMAPVEDAEIRRALGERGIRFETMELSRGPLGSFAAVARDAATITSLATRLRQLQADVYLGYSVKPVLYGPLAAAAAKVPMRGVLFAGMGTSIFNQERGTRRVVGQAVRSLLRIPLAQCQVVVFQNPDDLAELDAAGVLPPSARRVVVDGAGIDLASYQFAPLPRGPQIVLFVGRLHRDKGVLELVEAAKLLAVRRPDVRVQLLGDPDESPASITHKELHGWIRDGIVEYLGYTTDVRPFIAAASTVVLPSHREGSPRAIVEAMAMGRPIITTDAPGCRQCVVDGDNGYLVPVRHPRALADAIERLLSDRGRLGYMAMRARLRAEQRFDARIVTDAMLDALAL